MKTFDWEPLYGFTSTHSNIELAKALEAVRRRACAYGGRGACDCKFGLQAIALPKNFIGTNTIGLGSEKTGCPELRELIQRLLYRPDTFVPVESEPEEWVQETLW